MLQRLPLTIRDYPPLAWSLALSGKHSFFGEMALLDKENGRATANVVAKGFCEGYHLSRANFHELQVMAATGRSCPLRPAW